MKSYLCEINKNYSLWKQIKLSIFISLSLFSIDFLDIPSAIMTKYSFPLFCLVLVGVVIIAAITMKENGFFDAFKIPSINHIDFFVYVSLYSIIIYKALIGLIGKHYPYKTITLGILLTINLIILFIRFLQYKVAEKQSEEYQSNIVDLKDLYEGKTKVSEGKPILIDEKDVDYDLLNRDRTIGYLYDAVVSINPDGKFVISLEGPWGSGKTTILENVKKLIRQNNKDIVIIDEFDPWIYGDENALLLNMFELIIQKSGFKYKGLFAKKIQEDLSELIFGTKKSSLIKSVFFEKDVASIKSKINNFLRLSKKKYVFVIDNIDRAEHENVIFLFKSVGSILNFERITYVLSFDGDEVKKIFEQSLKINYEYLKKIINLQIRVPEIDKSVLSNIYDVSLKRMLTIYGEKEKDLSAYDGLIRFISDQRLDVRDFKRFINSAVNFSFKTNHYLYKKDLLIMGYIKLFNFSLYTTIYENKKFFISHDQFDSDVAFEFSASNFNDDGKSFFTDLFKNPNNQKYKTILGEVFPYVKRYNQAVDLVVNTGLNVLPDKSEHEMIAKQKRICSGKYFDLYFTDTNNVYVGLANIVDYLIKIINEQRSFDSKEQILVEILNEVHYSYHKVMFQRVQLRVEDIAKENIYDFIKILYNNVENIDDSREFMTPSARNRVALILQALLNKISDAEYEMFLASVKEKYNKLGFLQEVSSRFANEKEDISDNHRKELLDKVTKGMAASIVNNNINLYEDIYYMPKNIWGIWREYTEEQEIIKKYIKAIVNEKNIFRFLNDLIVVSIGSAYRYRIKKEDLEQLTCKDDINSILNRTKPKTDDEQFVLEVYRVYDEEKKNAWGEQLIVEMPTEKKLLL